MRCTTLFAGWLVRWWRAQVFHVHEGSQREKVTSSGSRTVTPLLERLATEHVAFAYEATHAPPY
jgi:hypothetical protein